MELASTIIPIFARILVSPYNTLRLICLLSVVFFSVTYYLNLEITESTIELKIPKKIALFKLFLSTKKYIPTNVIKNITKIFSMLSMKVLLFTIIETPFHCKFFYQRDHIEVVF